MADPAFSADVIERIAALHRIGEPMDVAGAVVFLFVVMMLDVDFVALRVGFARYLPIGAAIAVVLTVEMIFVASSVATTGAAEAR